MAKNKVKPDYRAVLKRLEDLPQDFLDCRDMMHAWKRVKSYIPLGLDPANPKQLLREMECLRCGTIKRDVFTARTLERTSTSYSHPAGYLIRGGNVPNRGQLTRRVLVERSADRRARAAARRR